MNRGTGTPSDKTPQPLKSKAAEAGVSVMKMTDRAWHFVDGTIRGALDTCAKFGRRGLWVGVAAGVLAMTIPGGVFGLTALALPFYGALAGGLAGAVLGLATGTLRGGVDRLALENRKEKYANELDERRKARSFAPNRQISSRAYDRYRDNIDRITYDKIDQYNDRTRANQGSWAERVDASRDNSQLGR